jgi:choline kinase
MKVILLVAGKGERLRPYTNERPKCMVELGGIPLLQRQLDVLREVGILNSNIAMVGGYRHERLDAPGIKKYVNDRYAVTNMVSTLFCAEDFLDVDEDLLICYGDIVYQRDVLQQVLDTDGDIVIGADQDWYGLWSLRMDDPLSDAETFKIKDGRVVELGKKPNDASEIQAQYMGIIKVSRNRIRDFIDFYHALDRDALYDGKDFDNMYMTSLLQELINLGWQVRPALVCNGWLEIDLASDLELFNGMLKGGRLYSYIRL